jgi:hypothetical protein
MYLSSKCQVARSGLIRQWPTSNLEETQIIIIILFASYVNEDGEEKSTSVQITDMCQNTSHLSLVEDVTITDVA